MNRSNLKAGKVISVVFCKEGNYIQADEERCFSFKGIAKVASGSVFRSVFPRTYTSTNVFSISILTSLDAGSFCRT
jgi:hypothetical protein